MAPAVELATGYISLAVSSRGLARQVSREFAGIERQAAATGKRSGSRLGGAIATGLKASGIVTGVAGVVGGFGKAITSAGDFEKSMRLVAVTSKAGKGELASLTQTAIDMGAKTSFSAQGASDAMVALAKGGLKAAEIQGGALEQTLTLATAGGLELGNAADYMVSGLRAFGLEAKDSARVAAALAGGSNASTASVESMGLALQQVAAQANTAGLSIEDTTAGIAALANNGIQGSDAGTSLKVMLQRLVPQTDKATAAFEELGLITEDGKNKFFDAQGNMKSLTEVSGLLSTALKDQTKEQKTNTLYRLFGSDASRAAAILTKEGAAGMAEFTKATSDQTAAQNLAQNATQGFAGAMERFKGSLETIGIQLGTVLLPYLTKFLNFLSGSVLPALSTFGGFLREHKDLIGTLAVVVGVFAAGMGALILPMKIAALATKAWAAAQVILNIALTANPIGLVIVAIGALVAGLIYAWKHSETFRNVVIAVWTAVKNAVLAVVNWLVTNVPAAWNKITTVVSHVVGVVAGVLKKAFNLWTLPLRLVLTVIGTIWALFWLAIRKPVTAAFNFVKDRIIIPVWRAIVGRFRASTNTIRALWTKFWSLVRTGAQIMWRFVLNNIILPVWNRIKAVWTAASSAVRTTWNRFWSAIKAATTPALNFVRDKVRTVLDKIKAAFSAAKASIKKIWDGLKDVVSKPVRWVVDHVYNKPLVPVWNRVAGLVNGPKLNAYAKGGVEPYGVRPGYTPGRDTHPIMVGGGEAIMRPEFTRAVGSDWVNRANKAARKGRARRFVREGGLQGFAGGGVVGWLKGIASNVGSKVGNIAKKVKDWVLGGLRSAAGKILSPVKGLIDKAMPNSGVGRTVGGIGKKAIDLVLDKIKKEDAQAMASVGQGAYTGPPGTGSRRRVRWHGGTFTERFRNTLEQAQRIAGTYINVLQGGFSRSVRASGTSHYGDAIDTSWKSAVLHGLRKAGVAAWHRTPAQGFPHHIHGVPLPGRGYPAGSGTWQAQDYLRGGNGLALGGIVKGGRGGIWTQIGEGKRDELVLPLPQGWRAGSQGGSGALGAGGVAVYGDIHGYSAEEVAAQIEKKARRERALRPIFA